MPAITCTSLTKIFDKNPVVDDITFEVEEGAIAGIVGDDGAGKTTLLKLLTGLLRPSSGTCTLFDTDVTRSPARALKGVGCLVGEPAFYEEFTAQKNLELFAALAQVDSDGVTDLLGITFKSTRVRYLTPAMKKLLGIAVAFLAEPKLLILDEPLNLNASAQGLVKKLLKEQKEKGNTILFTTGIPADVKELATYGVVLKEGKAVSQGAPKTLDFKGVNP
ncbi:MAG: ATP-binding cassette domain-containing protein [Theionarchaea archaeon]|nr:ATP-binding cassette domain-containing protein [Theionarchaea archaeon]